MTERFSYPVDLLPDEDGRVVATFPDLQGGNTDGADRAEAWWKPPTVSRNAWPTVSPNVETSPFLRPSGVARQGSSCGVARRPGAAPGLSGNRSAAVAQPPSQLKDRAPRTGPRRPRPSPRGGRPRRGLTAGAASQSPGIQAGRFMRAMPATTTQAAAMRGPPMDSRSITDPITAAKMTDVSRSAETWAMEPKLRAQITRP